MQYRNDRSGNPISLLGFGCMRFTKKGNSIDLDKAEQEVMTAIRGGVNYLDTAYIYPGSEVAVGEIIKRNDCRKRVNIATKLPQYYIKSEKAIDRYFNEQLERLQTDYIDYYLMHMLTDVAAWDKLKELGIEQWIEQKKKAGQIRNIGFSFHGNTEMFLQILEAYDWDFCQIQYNYMDEHTQAGRKGLQAAAAKGIPVIIMEPLRGGKLVDLLPEKAKGLIAANPKKRTPAEWAFRWLWEQPEVTCVLSGMNSVEMVNENVRIASEVQIGEFTETDYAMIEQIRQEIQNTLKVGCTGCGYCMPCPKGIDIPAAFRCYNHMYTEKRGGGRHEYLQTVCLQKEFHEIARCVECGKCESHCPQHLEIRKKLKEADKELLPFYYKIGLKIVRKLHLFW
ncbi:MAG: aldo/keto reductase [Eubacteriales bacterium]|nr:aldo/keto reductase [Eubacteriales bacterium]